MAGLLSSIDIERARLLESVDRVRWWPVVVAVMLRPLAVWARAWQARLLLGSAGIDLKVRDLWRAFMFGELLSRFIPGNLGTIAYVAKLSNQLGVALVAQLLDRVLFLALTMLVAALSLLGAGHLPWALIVFGAWVSGVLLAGVLYFGAHRWSPLSVSQRGTIERVFRSRNRWARDYVVAAALSLGSTAVLFGLLVVACDGILRFFPILAAVTLVTIGAALPITINGVGIREWVFVALLDGTLPSKEVLVTLAAITYVVGFASAAVGVVTWMLLGNDIESGGAQS